MKNTPHLFFVIFFAIFIVIGFALKAIGSDTTYESIIPEYSILVLFLLSLVIWLSEKFNKTYLFFVMAGLFILSICTLQALLLIEAEELWYKALRALVILFSIYIYITMFVTERWALLKKHNNTVKRDK